MKYAQNWFWIVDGSELLCISMTHANIHISICTSNVLTLSVKAASQWMFSFLQIVIFTGSVKKKKKKQIKYHCSSVIHVSSSYVKVHLMCIHKCSNTMKSSTLMYVSENDFFLLRKYLNLDGDSAKVIALSVSFI